MNGGSTGRELMVSVTQQDAVGEDTPRLAPQFYHLIRYLDLLLFASDTLRVGGLSFWSQGDIAGTIHYVPLQGNKKKQREK